MLALTLKKPWMFAILRLGKSIENRSWKPWQKVIGKRIALHCGHGFDKEGFEWILHHNKTVVQEDLLNTFEGGYISGTAVIESYQYINEIKQPSIWAFGDYCWKLSDVRELNKPIKCKGSQLLWKIPEYIEKLL